MEEEPADSRSKSRSNSQKAQQRGPRRRDSHESRSTRDSRSRHQEEHKQYSPIDIRLPLPEFLSKLRDHSNPAQSRSFTMSPGSPMDDPTTCQNLPAPIPALVPIQATYEYPSHPTPNPDSCLIVQIPDGLKVISSINYGASDCPPHLQGGPLRFNPKNSAQSQSWCDRIQFCQAHSNQVQSHTLDLSKRLRDRSIMNRASMPLGAKSVLIVAISVDTQSLETSSFRNRCEITRLCFGFNDIIMWNDDLSRRTQAIQKFVEWIKILRSVSEQFESVRLVFENVRSACLFVDFVYFVNLFSLLSSVVSTISILPDSPTMMERLIAINRRVPPTLDFNICVIRCAMLRDILEGENQTDESQDLAIKFDHSLNSTKLWRQVINFEDIIILDVKFYSRSEECLEVVQVNVFNSEGSMLRQFSALPQTFHVKELAKEMGYLEIDGHYTCNDQPVVTLKVLLQNFVTYLNDITAKRNIVLCTYSLEAVIAPLLNNLEAKRLLGDFRWDKLGLLDLVSCTSLKSVGELISQSQSERDKDIILQALKNGWENDSDRLKSHIQPLHLMSISFGPDILFLDSHNIQQVTSSNRVMIQTEMQDCDDFKYLLKLPSIDQDWRVQSVSKVRGQSIQIVLGAKKSPPESQISSLGYLVPSFQDRITLANLRVIAHLLGPEKAHSFRTMELWNKLIPVLEVKNVVYPHLLGHQEARKTVKELSYSVNVPSKYEVLSLSLGFSNEDIHQFSISNVSNGRHLNISNQCHDVEQELGNQLGRGVPKIVIGHNVMDMLDVLPNTSQVVGVIELEWLLLPKQRQDFENQPSWGEVVGKHLGFDFPFFPAETADINFYTLEFLKNLPHVSVNDLCQNVKKYMLPRSICADLRPRASNIFLLTDSKDPEDQASTSSTITVRPLGDLRSDTSINEQPLDQSPVPIDSDSADSDEPFICLEQGSRRNLAAKGVGYLRFNLLILNLKTTVADNTSFATAMEAYLPAKNKSFLEFILPEGINNDTLTERGYTWDGSTWSLVQEGCKKLVRSESECLQKLKNFVETGFGPHQRFVLVIPCVEALNQFLMMLKRHNRLKNFFVACRGWLDVKGLIYLRVLSPRQYFVKALDLESSELFQLYEYADTSPLGHVRQVPNVIAKILKTFKDLDFYRQALPICLNVKPYNLVFVNARALRYSVDPQYESLSVIHAKNMTSGQTFQCAIEPYGVWDPNLIQDFGYKRDSDSWILEQNGKIMPCLSLLDAMINFLRFSCADSKNVKTILVCSVFKESLAHIFEIVEFMRANCIFFNEVIAIFELATYLCREKHYRFLTTEAILNHYQAKTQGGESQPSIPSSTSDLEGQSEMILKCLALQAKEDSIAIEKMIAKFAHGWNSPAWNKLLKESNILMFQDHVFPVELASSVSVKENVPKLVPCQVAQPVISFSDRVFITLSHPMTNMLVHERIEMCPDRPFDLKITCHGNPSELKKGSVIGLICRQDRFLSYERERKRNLEAISQERLQFYQSSSREDLQDADASGPIMEALEQKPDIRALNQPRPDSTKAAQETQGPKAIPVEKTRNDTLPMEFSAVATEKASSCQKELLIRENPTAIPEKDILPLSKEPLNAGENISSCIKGKPLSPLVTPEPEEKEVAATLKCNLDQDLGQVLDKFMAAKEDHQQQQQPVTESSANVLTLNELQDKFYTLFEFPSFAPLMLSYIEWCCTTGNHVDEGIGDTIITHLVGMGCDSLDTLKDIPME
ncbi:hypothetical protein TCAL_15146 [Tigriopus californicus]|uniref:Uncharacterized protein n=1 Tax=Tigriopus californicus TaxID=6832 RepID=A0A553NVC6_TIGCA|nr:hypothetical protein TCAL_15146 [Tigriopus californicus]